MGRQDHETVIIEVHIRRDSYGRIRSLHKLRSKQDEEIVMSWPGGGTGQVAYAMLLEAIRREAVMDLLIHMTQDPEYLPKLKAMSGEDREKELKNLTKGLRETMIQGIDRVAVDVMKEVFHDLST